MTSLKITHDITLMGQHIFCLKQERYSVPGILKTGQKTEHTLLFPVLQLCTLSKNNLNLA